MTNLAHQLQTIPTNSRVIAYTRVSTEDQARDDAVSLPEQVRECEMYAEAKGLTVDHVVEDRASGRSINRPGFQVVLRHCESHRRPDTERGTVLCLDSSRWGRFVQRPSLATTFGDRLYLAGWDLVFVREPGTGNVDADVFLDSARSVASATESRRISYRAQMGMTAHAKQGHWQGRPPFGYDRIAINTATGTERRVEPRQRVPKGEHTGLVANDDATTVKRIFRGRARGQTYQGIADQLNAANVRGPFDLYRNRGDKDCWTACTVKSICTNEVYIGHHLFNRRRAPDPHGKRTFRSADEWVRVKDVHPVIISRAVWDKVQALCGTKIGTRHASKYLLTGMATCAQCGGNIVGGGGTRPNALDPDRFVFYKCRNCTEPLLTVNKRWLDTRIVSVVGDVVTELVDSGKFDDMLATVLGEHSDTGTTQRREYERRRKELRRQRDRLVDAIANGTLSTDDAREKIEQVNAELDEVSEQLSAAAFDKRRHTLSQKEIDALRDRARDFPARMEEAPLSTARQLLGEWLDTIVIDGDARRVTVSMWPLPSFAKSSPVRQDLERRCWRGVSRPSFRR